MCKLLVWPLRALYYAHVLGHWSHFNFLCVSFCCDLNISPQTCNFLFHYVVVLKSGVWYTCVGHRGLHGPLHRPLHQEEEKAEPAQDELAACHQVQNEAGQAADRLKTLSLYPWVKSRVFYLHSICSDLINLDEQKHDVLTISLLEYQLSCSVLLLRQNRRPFFSMIERPNQKSLVNGLLRQCADIKIP